MLLLFYKYKDFIIKSANSHPLYIVLYSLNYVKKPSNTRLSVAQAYNLGLKNYEYREQIRRNPKEKYDTYSDGTSQL